MVFKCGLFLAVTICCILQVYSLSGETILVPDDEGKPVEVLVQCPANYTFPNDLANQVKFYLFRRFTNNTEVKVQMTIGGAVPTIFLSKKPTKILIPGFMSTLDSPVVQSLKKAYFNANGATNVNVIAVDWASLAGSAFILCYSGPQENSVAVGHYIAQFVDYLVTKAVVELPSLHLIGHSLGAHVAGIAGANVTGTVARITGLDPIGVRYCSINHTFVLDKSDASFVDAIHTDTRMLGMKEPVGHVDFYPWGGGHQDGCSTPTCSHSMAVVYFKETIEKKERYPAYACASLNHLQSTEFNFTWDKCETKMSNYMGETTNINKTGLFYTSYPSLSASSQLLQLGFLQLLLVAIVTIVQGQS